MPKTDTKRSKIPKRAQEVLLRDMKLEHIMTNLDFTFPLPSGTVYEDLIEAIVYQQISIKAARSVFLKICAHFDGFVPEPHLLRACDHQELRQCGLSGPKAHYLINIATAFENGLDKVGWHNMSDDEVVDALIKIKGIGIWTARMILIFSLGREDIFPVNDLGIQKAMIDLYDLPTERKKLLISMQKISATWQPYQTYAARLLWGWRRRQLGMPLR